MNTISLKELQEENRRQDLEDRAKDLANMSNNQLAALVHPLSDYRTVIAAKRILSSRGVNVDE